MSRSDINSVVKQVSILKSNTFIYLFYTFDWDTSPPEGTEAAVTPQQLTLSGNHRTVVPKLIQKQNDSLQFSKDHNTIWKKKKKKKKCCLWKIIWIRLSVLAISQARPPLCFSNRCLCDSSLSSSQPTLAGDAGQRPPTETHTQMEALTHGQIITRKCKRWTPVSSIFNPNVTSFPTFFPWPSGRRVLASTTADTSRIGLLAINIDKNCRNGGVRPYCRTAIIHHWISRPFQFHWALIKKHSSTAALS